MFVVVAVVVVVVVTAAVVVDVDVGVDVKVTVNGNGNVDVDVDGDFDDDVDVDVVVDNVAVSDVDGDVDDDVFVDLGVIVMTDIAPVVIIIFVVASIVATVIVITITLFVPAATTTIAPTALKAPTPTTAIVATSHLNNGRCCITTNKGHLPSHAPALESQCVTLTDLSTLSHRGVSSSTLRVNRRQLGVTHLLLVMTRGGGELIALRPSYVLYCLPFFYVFLFFHFLIIYRSFLMFI